MDRLRLAQSTELFSDQTCEATHMLLHADPMIALPTKQKLLNDDDINFLRTIPMHCVPELPFTILQDEPPSFEFFMNLPNVFDIDRGILRQSYLIYGLCLVKKGAISLLSIGSASRLDGSAVKRMDEYDRGVTLPLYVQKALEDGYEIVHICVILLMDVPQEIRTPVLRTRALLYEAYYTYTFWSIYETKDRSMAKGAEHKWRHLCPWDLDQFDYRGLNSHSPLAEKPKGLELTFEEASAMAEQARERHRAYMVLYNKHYNKTKMDNVRGVRTGVLSLEDPKVRAWNEQHDAHLARSKKGYDDMKDIVAAVKAGTLADTSDETVAKALKRKAGYDTRNSDRSKGLELLKKQAKGDLEDLDIDTEDERLMAAGRMQKKASDKQADRRREGVALCRSIDAGKTNSKTLTPEQRKLVDIGRKEIVRRLRGTAKAKAKKLGLDDLVADL